MSLSSVLSLVFERFSLDDLQLSAIYNSTLTSPPEHLTHLRSSAIAIQQRWEVFSDAVKHNVTSRSLGVETLAQDIDTYQKRYFSAIRTYLAGVHEAVLIARAEFPGSTDDYELGNLASVSLDAIIKNAGDKILACLDYIASGFSDVGPREDDLDAKEYITALSSTFQSFARELHPDAEISFLRAFQEAANESSAFGAVKLTPVQIYAAPAGTTSNLFPNTANSANLVSTGVNAAYSLALAHAAPGVKAVTMFVSPFLGAYTAIGLTGAIVANSLTIDTTVMSNGFLRYILQFSTTQAGGAINLVVTTAANAAAHVTIESIERVTGSPLTDVALGGTVIDAVQNGRTGYLSATFECADVAKVINLVSRRDQLAARQSYKTLSDIIRGVWRSFCISNSAPVAVVGALDALPKHMVYTSVFWGGDPMAITPKLIAAGLSWDTDWVNAAYAAMYRAFFAYVQSLVSAGLVDRFMIAAAGVSS